MNQRPFYAKPICKGNPFTISGSDRQAFARSDYAGLKSALAAMDEGKLTPEFVHLSEIVFAVSGLVGGFGDKYARNAPAHAMHDAMSKFYQKVMTIYMAKK